MDLDTILKNTQNPNFKIADEIMDADHLVVVLTEEDLFKIPAELAFLGEYDDLVENLKKNKSALVWGRNSDSFSQAHIALVKLDSPKKAVAFGADLTRAVLHKNKWRNPLVYFTNSIALDQISTILHGMLMTNYCFSLKTDESTLKRYESLTFKRQDWTIEAMNKAGADAKYTLFGREIVNRRANLSNPVTLLELVRQIAKKYDLKLETIVGKDLEAAGLNLLYSVGRGASKPPVLVVAKYEGNPTEPKDLIALVGKGVCFDAGGLNIKPTGGIEDMYADKGGSMAVISAFYGIVDQKLPVNVVLGTFFVENLLGSDSYHPNDILTSYKGLTVEIGNTDAEGRLCLADTMSYVQKNYQPHTLVEFSTLTGACVAALGFDKAGLWTNSEQLHKDLYNAADVSFENLWRMPLTDEDRENTKSKYADLSNAVTVKFGASGSNRAAAFLEFFVEKDVNWAHIDMAGPGLNPVDKFLNTGAIGAWGVQLALNFVRSKAKL